MGQLYIFDDFDSFGKGEENICKLVTKKERLVRDAYCSLLAKSKPEELIKDHRGDFRVDISTPGCIIELKNALAETQAYHAIEQARRNARTVRDKQSILLFFNYRDGEGSAVSHVVSGNKPDESNVLILFEGSYRPLRDRKNNIEIIRKFDKEKLKKRYEPCPAFFEQWEKANAIIDKVWE